MFSLNGAFQTYKDARRGSAPQPPFSLCYQTLVIVVLFWVYACRHNGCLVRKLVLMKPHSRSVLVCLTRQSARRASLQELVADSDVGALFRWVRDHGLRAEAVKRLERHLNTAAIVLPFKKR